MLCYICNVSCNYGGLKMSIGSSGRIVIEVDPEVKRLLYATLALEGSTLKEWFLSNVDAYLKSVGVQNISSSADQSSPVSNKKT